MAGQKSRTSRVSSGKMKGIRKERVERKLNEFAKRREEGTNYQYQPNPYTKGTIEWTRENLERKEKIENASTKTEFQKFKSVMSKLNNGK